MTLQKSMHPFIIARFIGSNILYQQLIGKETLSWMEMSIRWNQYFLQKNVGFWRYPYFQHMMCDYLNLAGLFKESYQIKRTINFTDKNYEIEKGYPEALEVVKKIAHHTSSEEGYKTWFKSTKTFESIHPLFKRYYRLQALSIYNSIVKSKRKKQKTSTELKDLINQTGFTFFEKFIE